MSRLSDDEMKKLFEDAVRDAKLDNYDDYEILKTVGNKVYVMADVESTQDVDWKDYLQNIKNMTGLTSRFEEVDEDDPEILDELGYNGYDPENNYIMAFVFEPDKISNSHRSVKSSTLTSSKVIKGWILND